MSETLQTVILVTDKGSQTFLKVGESATKMGNTIDQATTKASKSTDNLAKRQAALGGAFTSLQGLLSVAARANAAAEASQARLSTAIDNTGHVIDEYQDQLDAASKKALQLGFDDEDAADSIAKLTTATGDAQKAIDDLSLAEDIARARGVDLSTATRLVVAAEQGRFGMLQRVGIQLDATATKEQALDALRGKYAGNAEAYANTTAGAMDRYRNSVENTLEAIGAHLGPMQSILLILPGLSAGYTAVGAAVGALVPEMGAATIAAGALDIALGPVGIVAAALAAGVALYELNQHFKETKLSADDITESVDNTADFLQKLATSGATPKALEDYTKYSELVKDIGDRSIGASLQIEDLTDANGQLHLAMLNTSADQTHQLDNYQKQIDANNKLIDSLKRHTLSEKEFADGQKYLQGIFENETDLTFPAVQAELAHITEEWENGSLSSKDYITNLKTLSETASTYSLSFAEIAAQTKGATEAVSIFSKVANTGLVGSARILHDEFQTLDGDGIQPVNTSLAENARAQNEAAEASKAATAAFFEQAQGLGLLDTELERLIGAGVSTWAQRTSQRVQGATEALGTAITVIIDGTKNLGSQSQGLDDWATGLIGVTGSYGKIDDLLASGQISLTTYNQAQQAQVDISADNVAIQEDLLRIQTKQAPILADAADKQAKYIDQLADLPPLQQEVALGWQDQGEALKAQNALQLASAEGASELGTAANLAATSAITAAAKADPILSAMLQDMGLISVGAQGEITLNFPNADKTHEDTVNLTESIDALTVALGGVPPDVHTNITATDNASGVISRVSGELDLLNGRVVTTYVQTIDQSPYSGVPTYGGGTINYQQGGIIPHAQTGIIPRDSGLVMVGEAGPELMRVPGGSMVYPHGASMEMANRLGKGGGGDIHLHNSTINLYPPDQNVYHALRGQLYSGSR